MCQLSGATLTPQVDLRGRPIKTALAPWNGRVWKNCAGAKTMARRDVTAGLTGSFGTRQGGDALFAMGLMYAAGREVAQDLVEAHKWFNLSAMKGHADARRHRGELTAELSKVQLARAQRLAREWLSQN
jgi:uncharacterized protein